MRSLITIVALLITGSASATTITFEDSTGGFDGVKCNDVVSGGFVFHSYVSACIQRENLFLAGSTTSIHLSAYEDSLYSMEALSGESFSLSSFEYTNFSPVSITGYYTAGGSVQVNIPPSPYHSLLPWRSLALDSSWHDLQKVTFLVSYDGPGIPGVSIDNMVASTVPVPAAVWLFGSALAVVGWLRRNQTV